MLSIHLAESVWSPLKQVYVYGMVSLLLNSGMSFLTESIVSLASVSNARLKPSGNIREINKSMEVWEINL